MKTDYIKYLVDILKISVPLIVGNIGHVLIGATDVLVAAKYSINALAAIAIANSILFTVFIVGLGFLAGISIILSNYRGERKKTKQYLFSGIVLSQILSLLTFLVIIGISFAVPFFGFEEILVKNIQEYMQIIAFSMFGMFAYQAVKEFLQAHEIVKVPNFILIVAVFLNLFLNIIFVFGYGFIPSLGVAGLAVSTLLVRMFLGLSMILYTGKILYSQQKTNQYNFDFIKKVLKIGMPIGVGLLFEFLAFNIVTMSIGRISGLLAATHNILLTIVDVTFMIPFAISSALAIKVGYYNGENNLPEIKNYGKTGVGMSAVFMIVCSFLFLFAPDFFIGIFTRDEQIISIAKPIVTLFALFELADGIQISLGGILKGLKYTKQLTYISLSSYWLIGLPCGFYLAFGKNLLLQGFWQGLTIALFVIAIIEYIFIIIKLKDYNQKA